MYIGHIPSLSDRLNDGKTDMDDLTSALRKLCKRHRDGSAATQADRLRVLTLIAQELRETGFIGMTAASLKGKHVQSLVMRWQSETLAAGTIRKRLTHVRWWAAKIGKANIFQSNGARQDVFAHHAAAACHDAVLFDTAPDEITEPRAAMLGRLRAALGLRQTASINFQPIQAGCIKPKNSRPITVIVLQFQ